MIKREKKTMKLHRETLRRLSAGELQGAAGGTTWTGGCCTSVGAMDCEVGPAES